MMVDFAEECVVSKSHDCLSSFKMQGDTFNQYFDLHSDRNNYIHSLILQIKQQQKWRKNKNKGKK